MVPADSYVRAIVQRADLYYEAKPIVPYNSSLTIQMMSSALLRVPKEAGGYRAGDIAEVELRCPLEWTDLYQNAAQEVNYKKNHERGYDVWFREMAEKARMQKK